MGAGLALLASAIAVAQESPPAADPRVPALGQLVVFTDPPGAEVIIDGAALGPAPLTARDLLPGTHLVQVSWPEGTATVSAVVLEGTSTPLRLRTPLAPAQPASPPPFIAPLAARWRSASGSGSASASD